MVSLYLMTLRNQRLFRGDTHPQTDRENYHYLQGMKLCWTEDNLWQIIIGSCSGLLLESQEATIRHLEQWWLITLNTFRQRQNGCHFADAIFKCIFLNENAWILIRISLKFVPEGPTLVQIIAEAIVVRLPMHMCHPASMSWYIKRNYMLSHS